MTNDDFSQREQRAGAADWFAMGQGLERRDALVCGFKMSYVTGGHGDAIVLLHGLGSDSSTWRKILPTLAQHYTVYALDMFGCGRSDKPAIEYTIEAMAHYVRFFMDAVGIQQAHFIGHSYGGGITMQTLYFSPDRMRRVVLLDSGGLGRDVHWLLRISTLPGAHRVIGMLSDPRSGVIPLALRLEQRQRERVDAAYESELPVMLGRLREHDTRRSFLRMVRGIGNVAGQTVSALPHLPKRAETPLLLIWGAKDAIIPVAHGQATAALLPRAHLEVLPDCYHQPHMDCPQQVLALTLNFLQAEIWPPEAVADPIAAEDAPVEAVATANPAHHKSHPWRWIAPAAVALAGVPAGVTLILTSHLRRREAAAHPAS